MESVSEVRSVNECTKQGGNARNLALVYLIKGRFGRGFFMQKIVIKIGSSILVTQRGQLDELRIAHIANQVLSLRKERLGVVLIVSGAVACGARFIKFSKQQKYLRQASAGIGQTILTATFSKIFSQKEMQIAQLLLTKESFHSEAKKQKTKSLLEFYIQSGFITLINENDVIDLNSFGGNDFLAAQITSLLKADRLLILSTMKGSIHGIGGGKTKLEAIDMLSRRNIKADILNGKSKNIILNTIL